MYSETGSNSSTASGCSSRSKGEAIDHRRSMSLGGFSDTDLDKICRSLSPELLTPKNESPGTPKSEEMLPVFDLGYHYDMLPVGHQLDHNNPVDLAIMKQCVARCER